MISDYKQETRAGQINFILTKRQRDVKYKTPGVIAIQIIPNVDVKTLK